MMGIFYKFKPVDTLFFKGAEPMSMGEDHTSTSVFPPPANTITGALRTAYLKQHNISFKDYADGNIEDKTHKEIGLAGKESSFSIVGPFFKKGDNYYIPAPFNWYSEKNDNKKKDSKRTKIIRSKKIKSSLIISKNEIYWVKGKGEVVSIGGKWIKVEDLYLHADEIDLLKTDDFADSEPRTGIKLDGSKRTVMEGHLYSFTHTRLKDDVELVFGIDKEIDIEDKGILKLGGEQRFGEYQRIENPFPEENSGENFLSLSLIKGSDVSNNGVLATGKIKYIGGWDMVKGFHKDLVGYFPAGSVFKENFNNNLIQF